ncbi:hypothetical protein CBR_g34655 [Chara braunii]|uniref:Integrase catalytic domain-containing protein n=1 Tax=Chara braunii TaxID=69332 RepID=A0A388JYV9_CHABU|nr:hypothetical protein CBR_g34655 [Chara braunii]|eukprot:GBG62955.1 hypothetical protein CBR_g34655 [Chara braunii]
MPRRMTFWADRPRGILPPRISQGSVEISPPARNTVGNPVMDWVGVELVEDTVYLVVKLEWRARGEFRGVDLNRPGRVHATGSLHLSDEGWRTFGIALASGDDPVRMFEGAWQATWQEGFEFADPERDDVTAEVKVTAAGVFELPNEVVRMKLGKMATEEETDNCKSEGEPGLEGSPAPSEGGQKDRESINPDGTKGNRKEISTGESSGKAGGSRQGTQGTKEGRNKDRTSPRNSEGAMPKKVRVTDTRRKLAEIDKRTAEYKARLIEEMMTRNEEGRLQEVTRDERKASQGGTGQGDKGSDRGGTPSKRRKERGNSSRMEAEKATTPPAMDSRASRLPITPAVAQGCEGLWSLRERVLGWFDPERTMKTREGQKTSKESPDNSVAGEANNSKGGLKKIVSSLARALNKNQGYLTDAKKKLTFDGANITEFLIDYENVAALLKWTEEEKMDHLGQHVSLSLRRDIMVIVAASRSWKETRDVMMRKYLAAEKMATGVDLATVQRKNFATTVTDLAEKTVVTETLALLKEGEIIDLTGRTGNKVKKGIESLHERVHGVNNKIERMEGALLVMQAQVSRPALPPQEAVVPPGVPNRGFGRRDPANEQCKYCTAIGHYVRACPKLNHDILKRRCTRSLKGEIFGPQGERVNWNSPGGMRRVIIMLNGLEITVVEAQPVGEIIWDQLRGRGPQANFILESDGRDRVNATTRLGTAGRRINRDTIMEEVAGSSEPQAEPEAEEPEKVYEKPREEEPADKDTSAKKKFRYQIPILTLSELDDTISKLLGTMVSVSFQTMLQASLRLLKRLRQLLTRRRVEIGDNPELLEGEREEEAPQEVANLQRSQGDLEDIEKAFADIRLSLPDREGGEVMRLPPGTKLSFHALPVGKLKIHIGSHHTDALEAGSSKDRQDITVADTAAHDNGGMEDAEPIDAFLEYEGGTLAVDNKMMSEECTSGELLIQTLEKGAPVVVAELREGPVTTRGRREEHDSWGAMVGPKEELMAMAVEGGQEAVMSLVESWKRKKLQWVVNQMQEGKDGGQEGEEFFYVQLYEGLFREIGLLLVGNKQPTEVSIKAREEAERYVLRGGHLFRREEGAMPRRVVCGRPRQVDVIQAMHDGLAGGHRSSKGTLAKITSLYYWSGMADMVAIYCQTCLICQERSSVQVFEPLRPTRVLGSGHLVHLDLAVMLVSTDGYRYILDARDNLSGFVEKVALKKKTGRSVTNWIEDFYLRHPFVRRFIADNETEFVNQEVLGMLKRLCVPIKLIEPYHPEANAPVERGHRTLKNTIAKLAADHLGNWPRYLKQVVFAENMTPKRTTGCIPAELWYGREIDFPVEALVPTWNRLDDDLQMTTEELIEARCQQILKNEKVMKDIASRVLDSRMRDKARWDQVKNIRKEPLQVGEMVLLRNSALESTWSGQLGRRFKGPYRVAKRVGLNTFKLEDLDETGLKGPFPGQRLIRFLSRDPVEQWLQEAEDKEIEEPQAKD